jgi:hypothetical protein
VERTLPVILILIDVPDSIGVLESLDKPIPIGIANCMGRDPAGLAV